MLRTQLLGNWLADAYGTEAALVDVMSKQLSGLSGQHEMESRFLQYLEQIQRHANMIQERVGDLGSETSALNQGGLPALVDSMTGLWTKPTSSMLVKYAVVDTMAVHYEIAQVGVASAGARAIGDEQTLAVCQDILREKREMAQWLDDYLPRLVHQLTNTIGGGEDTSTVEEQRGKVDGAGTLRRNHLYAVADDDQIAREVEQALTADGIDGVERLEGKAAATALTGEAKGPSGAILGAIRSLKTAAGETQQAEHYATHVENGRIVLSIPCDSQASADRLIDLIKEHGGYDFAYFSEGSIEGVE